MQAMYGIVAAATAGRDRFDGDGLRRGCVARRPRIMVPALGLAPSSLRQPLPKEGIELGMHLLYGVTVHLVRRLALRLASAHSMTDQVERSIAERSSRVAEWRTSGGDLLLLRRWLWVDLLTRPAELPSATPRTNGEWLMALRSDGEAQAAALRPARVPATAALYQFHSPQHLQHLATTDVEQLAEDCAQDALSATGAPGPAGGESRFTTWAYKFAVMATALMAARRERWCRMSPDPLESLDRPHRHRSDASADPHGRAALQEMAAALQAGIEAHHEATAATDRGGVRPGPARLRRATGGRTERPPTSCRTTRGGSSRRVCATLRSTSKEMLDVFSDGE